MATSTRPSFTVTTDSEPDSETLLCGLSEFGLAGLTAADYLVEQLALEPVGHVTADGLPAITPFEAGTPRHHTRLFSRPDLEVTVLVGELLVPGHAAGPFAEGVLSWAEEAGVSEVVVLSGVPIAHGPDDHRPFYIASDGYQRARNLDAAGIQAMSGGYLDGFNGTVTARGLDSPLRTAVFTTPAHAQAPDAEAALRLLNAVLAVYDLDVDTGPLEGFAAEVSKHYEELAERMAESTGDESMPEDRMYM